MGKILFAEEGTKPQAPPTGQLELYAKSDDNLYVQNSAGLEVQLNIPAISVTSVGLLDGSTSPIYTVSNSPVTSTGNLTFSLNTQSSNTLFAGPSSGSAAQPGFRSLVLADLPSGVFNYISPITTVGDLIIGTGSNTANRIAIGSNGYILTSNGTTASWQPSSGGGGSGTVTSVALADGSTTPIYGVSGSPITTNGTLTNTLLTQSANLIFSGPSSGSAAQPGFRSLVSADIPSLSSIYLPLTGGTLTGSISATNFSGSSSGSNTGDQTITLTGNVTGSGAGSFSTTIASNVVTNSMLATMTTDTVKANITGSTANPTDVSLVTTATANSVVLRDSSGNTAITNLTATQVNGVATGSALTVVGGTASGGAGGGLNLNGASGSSSGGNGGTVAVNGGNANSASTAQGGAINLTAGTSYGSSTGGTITISSGTGGPGTGTAGATGGTTNITGGNGGVGSSTSGNGGGATLKAGSGGGGVAGGTGGTAQITGGTGGAGSASGGNGGAANVQGGSAASFAGAAGGAVTVSAGNGSGTGSGGAGGSVTISTGTAGGDNTVNNNGGSLTMSVGHSMGSAGGAAVTITAGTGGVGSSTAGANGGNTTVNAGNGGVGSSTGGNGGNVTLAAGTGGNSTTPGSGGYISFQPASTTSTSEVLRVTATNVYTTNAPLSVNTAGYGLQIKHGSNCKLGTSTLSAGSVTVANTAVTSNSIIFLTVQASGGTMGFLSIGTKTAGTSFVINSSSSTDTSTVAWMIVEGL